MYFHFSNTTKSSFSLFTSLLVISVFSQPGLSLAKTAAIETVTVIGQKAANNAKVGGISLNELPINAMVINSEEIERIRFVDPDELLDRIPGETQVRNLRIPNGGKSYTLAFSDGLPVESPYEGATQRFDRVNTHDIERVEVYKGPVSALFPNNLLGGAINVVSKKPQQQRETEVWYELGSYDRRRLGVNGSGALIENKTFYVFDASMRDFEGMRREGKNDRDQFSLKLQHNFDDAKTLTLRTERLNEDTVVRKDLTAKKIKADKRQAAGVNSAQDLTQQTFSLSYDQTLSNGLLQLSAVHREKDTVGLSRFRGPQDAENSAKQFKALWRHDFDQQNIIIGTDQYFGDVAVKQYRRRDVNLIGPFSSSDNTLDISAYFVQHQIDVTEQLKITSGLRYEQVDLGREGRVKQSAEFDKLAPKLGVNYQITDEHQVWLGLGQGFYVPQMAHLYGRNGNPHLKPEEADHWELGFRGNTHSWHYNTAYYHQKISNYLVTQEFFENGREIERTTNAGQVTVSGLESVVEYIPENSFWRVALTHTYADNRYDRFESSKGNFTGNDLARSPKHHANLRFAVLPMDDLVVELETDLYSSYYSDDNNSKAGKFKRDERLNLRVNYDCEQWGFWLNANNLTDTVEDRASYRVRRGVGSLKFRTTEGRNIVAGIRYRF